MDLGPRKPAISDRLMKRIAWRLAPLMIVMYIANQLDRANIGYAALTMNAELHMTTAQFGFAASLFFLGYILFEVPSNLCMHRFGARLWMTRILLSWGLLSSLTSFVPDSRWLYIARFFLGAFEAGLFPGMVYYLTLWMPARNRVWMMSLFVTAIPLTGVLGAPVSTWLMTHANVFGITGWRAMILLEGVPAIILAGIAYFWLTDDPSRSRWLSAAERSEIAAALAAERAEAAAATSPSSALRALGNPKVWALGVVYFGTNAGIIGLLYFLPQVIKTFESTFGVKYSLMDIGLITAIPFGVAVVATLIWGRVVSRHQVGAWHVAGPLLVCAAALSVALLLKSPYQSIIALSIGSAACFCSITTFWQLPSRILTDRAAAAGIALITSIGVSSGFLLPYFIGWVKDTTGTFVLAFVGIAATMVLASITVTLLETRWRKIGQPQLASE
ncbi:MFS transporter [Paraburkholderia elongata]|uniref:MFS transporter n=1 Tax=Paraburkholderia elongata TaxID=2675747 RepID=A0A972NPN9_9BURK|nr:MFS transporter [Paraburkholderia elongata]NPT57336.1 MFS transporter [Paraburkholderia elongata]